MGMSTYIMTSHTSMRWPMSVTRAGRRGYGIGKTSCIWTSSRVLICWWGPESFVSKSRILRSLSPHKVNSNGNVVRSEILGDRNGRRQVTPMRPACLVQKWPNDLVHPTGRRSCPTASRRREAADVGRGSGGV